MRILRASLAAAITAVVLVSGGIIGSVPAEASISLKAVLRYTAVHLAWSSQGSGKTYQVQYAPSSKFTSATTVSTTATSTIINHLTANKTYYFRVRVAGKSWSASVSRKAYRPSTFGGYAVQKPIKVSTDNVSGSTIDLSWATASGQYACFRISISPSPSGGQPATQCTTSYTITGLKRSTTYSIKLYTVAPATTSGGISWPAIDISAASSTITRTTSNYALSAPSDLSLVLPQRTYQATLSWSAASPTPASTDYYQVLLGSDTAVSKSVKKYKVAATNTKMTITGLTSNHVYYARVIVINSSGTQRSDRSGYLLVKTLAKHGTLTGTVATSAPTGTVVAVAYNSSGELDGQADVASDGTYSLSVPPGAHRVRISYLGESNFYSSWVSATASPAIVSTQATYYTAVNESSTTLPKTTIGSGHVVSGSVLDNKTGSKVGGATVSIQKQKSSTAWETLGSTYSSGTYKFQGVTTGTYRFRISYLGSTVYKSTNVTKAVSGNLSLNLRVLRR